MSMNKEHIKSLINEQQINHTLDQSFYIDENIFKLKMGSCSARKKCFQHV